MSSRERWPSASNPQTPTVLAALATRLSGTVSDTQALSGLALEPRVLCLPGADRDSAFTNQSSGSQKVALQLGDRGRRSGLKIGGSEPARNTYSWQECPKECFQHPKEPPNPLYCFPSEPSLAPIIYPPTPFDIATRQKTLPVRKMFFR